MVAKREIPPTGILQEWVAKLGLRHQGVLVSIVRGCDTAPKFCCVKLVTRMIRGVLLNTHCADATKAGSYIEVCNREETMLRLNNLLNNGMDELSHHYVMHLIHACQIIAFKHPHQPTRSAYEDFYYTCCRKLHVNPEIERQMDDRLDADEETFVKGQ